MASSNILAGQQHNDILHINPVDDEERIKLVEELKRRGNAAFKINSLKEAEILYGRAIEICHDDATKIALYSNRSMTFAKMGLFAEAKKDADEYVRMDNQSPKAYYRLGVALRGLNKFAESIIAFGKSKDLEPSNRTLDAEIEKTKQAEVSYVNEQKRKKDNEEQEIYQPKLVSKRVVDANEQDTPSAKNSPTSKSGDVDLSMRGYRTTQDGRKTTFFNMERSEEELKLIGENKPQKLAEDIPVEETPTDDGASAWNQKGTFEEKDYSEWAKTELESSILKLESSLDWNGFEVLFSTEKFKDFEGNASKTFTRGKFRRIFDFNFKIPIVVKVMDKEHSLEKQKITFDLFFPEVSGDIMGNDEEIECEVHWNNRYKAGEFQDLITEQIRNNESGFRGKIVQAFHAWLEEFNKL